MSVRNDEIVPVDEIAPLVHREAMSLAATEFDRMIDMLEGLGSAEWSLRTCCPLWDVREMAIHVLAMAEAQASMRQFAHDFRAANKRTEGAMIDAMTARQLADRVGLGPDEVLRRLRAVAPKAVRARRRTPSIARAAIKMRADPPFAGERWPFGYLVDKIFTRDTWMHRLDISRATDRAMTLTAEHDGRLVADVVAEWASRHGTDFDLILLGPAGGHWRKGERGTRLELDATEFCSVLSGRSEGEGLLATPVPF
jgi:uncharacterized protein (TIGR03083 family)